MNMRRKGEGRMKLADMAERLRSVRPEDDAYAQSRRMFVIDGVCAGVITPLVTGVILAGLLKQLGIPDWLNGILGAAPSIAATAQLAGAAMVQNRPSRKAFVTVGALAHRVMFGLAFFCTAFGQGRPVGIALAVGLLIAANLWGSLINAPSATWLYSVVYKPTAGRYYARRAQLTQIVAAIVSLGAGVVLDRFAGHTGFFLVGGVILGLAAINGAALRHAEEPPLPVCRESVSCLAALGEIFINRRFRRVAVIGVLYSFCIYMVGPYYRVFIVSEMHMRYGFVNFISFFALMEHIAILRFWGRMGDEKSWGHVCAWAFLSVSAGTVFICFMQPGNAPVMHVLYEIISNIGYSVTGMALLNWQLFSAPEQQRTVYVGAANAVNGVMGLAGAFAGTMLMGLADRMQLRVFGMPIVGVHLMALVVIVIFIGCALVILRGREAK